MVLLTGPPGSGKTQRILERVRSYLAGRRWNFRLVVPTATMAEHLRNELAREGYVFRPGVITTLSRFVSAWAGDNAEPSEARLVLTLRNVLAKASPPAFRRVAEFAGFHATLARAIQELSSAGCDAAALRSVWRTRPMPPLVCALADVYAETEALLGDQQFLLRGARLRKAASVITTQGLPGISEIFFDGFFAFSDPELEVIEALCRHADLTVTLPEWSGSAPAHERLLSLGVQVERLPRLRPDPKVSLVTAPAPDHEWNEIARRILQEAGTGRAFREMAVIVRSAGPAAAAVESALVRFNIPVRAYFGRMLAEEGVIRFFSAVVEALLSGWDHDKVLAAVTMTASGAGRHAGTDRFEFAVRARAPGKSLEALESFAQPPGLRRLLHKLKALQDWPNQLAAPAEWRRRLAELVELFRPERPAGEESHETALVWRRQAAAVEAYETALEDAATTLPEATPVSLEEFWRVVSTVLETTALRVRDERRNVVHLLDAYEARQWELPVVFVCNLLEGQFPAHHSEEPVLNEETRQTLNAAGYRVRTAAAREEEERFLWHVAVSRATSKLLLSWSRFDAKGEENLRSFLLDEFLASRPPDKQAEAPMARPHPLFPPRVSRPVQVADFGLQQEIARLNRVLKPTGIEDFLQCPFLFFARHTLDLEAPPARPHDRLDFAGRGAIAHAFLERWGGHAGPFESLFESVFEEWVQRLAIPPGYAREAARLELERDLRQFLEQFSLAGFSTVETEKEFDFELEDGLRIRGRIDRLDKSPSGHLVVIDYKYVKPEKVRARVRGHEDGQLVQGGLYMLGAQQCLGHRVAGFLLAGVRHKPKWDGWHAGLPGLAGIGESRTEDELWELADKARERALEAFGQIGRGIIAPNPADPDLCEHCAFRDVCRIEVQAPAVAAAAEESE